MQQSDAPLLIGCDHAAVKLKQIVKAFLSDRGLTAVDVGTQGESSVDYPDYGIKVAGLISQGDYQRGILICGTGIGMSMVANKFPGVRAALCGGLFEAAMSRRHNDANVLVLGGRTTGDVLALEIVKTWLETPFDGGRHLERLNKFDQIDPCSLPKIDPPD